MKKILAVATALVLAISSLCVFVVADSEPTVYTYEFDNSCSGWTTVTSVDSTLYSALTATNATITVEFTVVECSSSYWNFGICVQETTGWASSTSLSKEYGSSSGISAGDVVSVTFDDISDLAGSSSLVSGGSNFIFNPYNATVSDVTITVNDGSTDYAYYIGVGWTTIAAIDSDMTEILSTSGATLTMEFSVFAYPDSGAQCYAAIAVQNTSYQSEDVLTHLSSSSSTPVVTVVTETYDDLSGLVNNQYYSEGSSNLCFNPYGFTAGSLTVTITVPASTSTATTYDITVDDTIENGDVTPDVTSAAEGDTVTLTVTPDSGYELDTLTVTDANGDEVTVASDNTFTMPASNVTVTATFVESDVVTYTYTLASASTGGTTDLVAVDSTLYEALTTDGATVSISFTVNGSYNMAIAVQQTSGSWGGSWWTVNTSGTSDGSTPVTYTWTDISSLTSSAYLLAGDSKLLVNNNGSAALTNITLTVTVPRTTAQITSTNSVDGVIYVNEDYHGILITRNGRRHLLCIPHTVDASGYCTVCHEYIGSDAEVETVSINGGEYVEAYYAEVGINSENDSRWGSKDLGGTELIEALSQDGAILVITRDGVSDTVFSDDGDFEKFGLVNAWWTGDGWVALGTAGHTSADEEGVVDCLSDDGTTVIYDGATVYAAWQALNLNTGSNTTIISNTSNSLSIVSVAVYVPADAVSVEEVEVSDPQESGETDSEDDGEDLTVDDSEPETPAETNPTTGAVLALVPMAIAGLAVVASKRR